MPTWTELISAALEKREKSEAYGVVWTETNAKGEAEQMREMLLDLPHHPNIGAITGIMLLTGDDPAAAAIPPGGLLMVCKEGRMSSGASGPILPNAAEGRDAVQPWRVTPVLGDVGGPMTAPDGAVVCPEEFKPPAVETAPVIARSRPVESEYGSSMPVGAGWLEGITYEPRPLREETRDLELQPRWQAEPGIITTLPHRFVGVDSLSMNNPCRTCGQIEGAAVHELPKRSPGGIILETE